MKLRPGGGGGPAEPMWMVGGLLPILPEAEVSKDNDGQWFSQTQDGRLEVATT